jgi:hypothetical protein
MPSIGASSALKIVRKKLELRKLLPPKVEEVKTQKNKPPNVTKLIPIHPKTSLDVALSLLEFKDDL